MKIMDHNHATPIPDALAYCWFCGDDASATCGCQRAYCDAHQFGEFCLICALGLGLFERDFEAETISGLIMVSLCAAANDPYIVIPFKLATFRPLPLMNIERLVGAVIKMLASEDDDVVKRAAGVLAATTNSWPTLDPSALNQNKYGISLLVTDQVRRWLLYILKQSRVRRREAIALAILDKLRTADFRDLYPGIEENLKSLSCSSNVTRVRATFETLMDFYPAYSHLTNEMCELLTYEQYVNRTRGAGATLERIYGPLLKHSPILARMLKKGAWLSSQARYEEWYYGQDEPV
jgi:hypothetical protein